MTHLWVILDILKNDSGCEYSTFLLDLSERPVGFLARHP